MKNIVDVLRLIHKRVLLLQCAFVVLMSFFSQNMFASGTGYTMTQQVVVNVDSVYVKKLGYPWSGTRAFIDYGESFGYFVYWPYVELDGSPASETMHAILLSAVSTGKQLTLTLDMTCGFNTCHRRISHISF